MIICAIISVLIPGAIHAGQPISRDGSPPLSQDRSDIAAHRRPSLSLLPGNRVVAAAFLIFLGAMGANTAFGVFFKPMLNDFGWTKALTAGAFSLLWIVNGIVGIAMGRFNDRFGSRGVITLSGLLLSSGYVLMSQVSAVWHLYLFYGVIVGTGMSGIWVPVMSTVARSFGDRRGIMTAIVMVGGGTGTLVAPPISTWLISLFAWRTSYIIVGCLVFIFVVLPAQFLRNTRPQADNVSPGQPEKRPNEPAPGGYRHQAVLAQFRYGFLVRV
jgi:MFS family permease